MKLGLIGQMVGLGAVGLLSACGSTQRANPCVAWAAYNGAYQVKYTAKPGQDQTCLDDQGLDGEFDTLSAEQYDLGAETQVAFFSGWSDFATYLSPTFLITDFNNDLTADFGRGEGVKLALGSFDTKEVGADNTCTIASTTVATNTDGSRQYQLTNMVFVEDANAQGTVFKADAKVTSSGCTADYSIVALAPPAACATDDDCLPTANVGAGRPLASGIASEFHTYCELNSVGLQQYSGYWFGNPDKPGLCFLAEEFPSICPGGVVEGGADCPVGK